MSLAGLIGVGSVAGYQAHFIGYDQGPFPLFLAGMQWNYYLLGDFEEGMQIGAQTLIKFTSRDAAHYIYYRNGTGLEIVPYLGYKVIVGPGITFNAQAGAGTIINKEFITTDYADTPDGSVERRGYYDYTSFLQPLLHLDFGWSF